jgi:uncharacterized iron-regulated membrane protein
VQWTRELHTGTLFGLPSKILVVVFAFALAVLAITGPVMWWNKFRAAAKGRRAMRERMLRQMRVSQRIEPVESR